MPGQLTWSTSSWRGSSAPMMSLRLTSISMSSSCQKPLAPRTSGGWKLSDSLGLVGSLTS